jgi:hypothetical protein
MTTKIEKTQWACPYCRRLFDDRDDATECANDCADIESPTEKNVTLYVCLVCRQEYDRKFEAQRCEDAHETKNDKSWQGWLEEQQRTKLLQAAALPGQKTIKEALQ